MPRRFLPDFGKRFLLDTFVGVDDDRYTSNALAENSGILPNSIRRIVISRAWSFLPDSTDIPHLKERLNLGGVASQVDARDEMALDLKARADAHNHYVVYFDPWSQASDVGYDIFADNRSRIGVYDGRVFKVWDGEVFEPEQIDDLITGVSYLKIVFISHADIRADMSDQAVFHALLQGATHIYSNAFDDESWIGAAVEAIELRPLILPAG